MLQRNYIFSEVLVIDDDELDQASIMRTFEKINFAEKVVNFRTGEAASSFLSHPASRLPELILIDVNIPRINGIEIIESACSRLAEANTIVALLLSCPLPRALHRRAAQSPVISAYLNKPVQRNALLSLAQNAKGQTQQNYMGGRN